MSPLPRTQEIARLNDELRTTFITGRVSMTDGVASQPEEVRLVILTMVREFSEFTPDNDPLGEHDFGSFDHPVAGRIFWKIDYYDRTLTAGSEDPADKTKTVRVLTIMLASEY
jgi:hypothetical protein